MTTSKRDLFTPPTNFRQPERWNHRLNHCGAQWLMHSMKKRNVRTGNSATGVSCLGCKSTLLTLIVFSTAVAELPKRGRRCIASSSQPSTSHGPSSSWTSSAFSWGPARTPRGQHYRWGEGGEGESGGQATPHDFWHDMQPFRVKNKKNARPHAG